MIAAVILAAGASARFGAPKALLPYRGKSLLRRAVESAAEGGCENVLVVLGHQAERFASELEGSVAATVLNGRWPEGMGTSISAGVRDVVHRWPECAAVLLLLCDQALLGPELVQRIRGAFDGAGGRIVACEYAGSVGVPAAFERTLFPELIALAGDSGAKAVLRHHADRVVRVTWDAGAFDIDSPDDYERLVYGKHRPR
jgi:molybdenum cofactor cytidylyltransferase